jgi:hypothetical protein
MNEEYGKLIVTQNTPEVNRILKVVNRIVQANQDIEQVKNTKWTVTVIDHEMVNAAAFPVRSFIKICTNLITLGKLNIV